jgi:hypothetical protein
VRVCQRCFVLLRVPAWRVSPQPQGFVMRGSGRFPALEAWFDAMESRATYVGTKSDHYTHCHDLPPQLGGEAAHRVCVR